MIASSSRARGVLARYGHLLPLTTATPQLTLGEGATPLVRAPALERHTGLDAVYLKCEGCNPTGSFKDRGMVLAVARAVEDSARAVVCASTGNTSAAAAAYAARAGLAAVVLVPHGYVALGKLAQALAYGAHVLSIQGNFDDALRLVRELGTRRHHRRQLDQSVPPCGAAERRVGDLRRAGRRPGSAGHPGG
jgi:threonine synthase